MTKLPFVLRGCGIKSSGFRKAGFGRQGTCKKAHPPGSVLSFFDSWHWVDSEGVEFFFGVSIDRLSVITCMEK